MNARLSSLESLRSSGRTVIKVDELVDVLDGQMSRSSLYEAIKHGEIPGVLRIGRRVLISVPAIVSWLEGDR